MKNRILHIIVLSLYTIIGIEAQSKYSADRYFKEYDYPKASELYTEIYNKGDNSELVISRIADSYYYNTETEKAEKWYKLLYDKYSKNVQSESLFRYAQVLKSNKKYELSDKIMLEFKQADKLDSRSDKLITTPDYVDLFNKESGDVLSLHNVSTNTKFSDFGGFGIKDYFYFASTQPIKSSKNKLYKWNKQPFLNLYQATFFQTSNKKIDLKKKKALPFPIQTNYHEANAVVTKNGRMMYFTRDNFDGEKIQRSKTRKINLKLYRANKENGKWSNIVELPFNSNEYSVGHPALSPDEKTLYFVSNMPGGYGSTDLYKVAVLTGNKFGEPENLGDIINTEGREMFPYIGKDNTLYFSSDGHLGLGALDIFESRINKSSFGTVKNIKAPFNSNLDDFGFWINNNETQGFFSSNRTGGKGDDDIYSFTLERKQNDVISDPIADKGCIQNINGLITNARSGNIMKNTTVKLLDDEGKVIQTANSDENGLYSFKIVCGKSYKVLATEKDYRPDFKAIYSTPETNVSNRADLVLRPLIVGNQIKINPIYFDYNKSYIRKKAEYELENIVSVLKNHPNMRIRIESHTDSRGNRHYNRELSDRRAKSTRDYIISRGISSTRIISAIGYGEDQLLNSCDDFNAKKCTEEEHQKNRRSYFYIISDNKYGSTIINNIIKDDNSSLKNNIEINKKEKNNLIYKVQVGISNKAEVSNKFLKIGEIEVIQVSKHYKYYCCTDTSLSLIKKEQKRVRDLGYKDAFVVPFLNGKKISMKEALVFR